MSNLPDIASWFLIFIIYSFVGWVFEVIVAIVASRKLTNRGFLVGPICPIYGVGAVLISLILGNVENVAAIFCVAMVGATTLEYLTSWAMERLFHVRWWDYADMPFNLNGRICLHASLAFGLLGVLVVRYINPFLLNLLSQLDGAVVTALASTALGLLLADICLSLWMIVGLKVTVDTMQRDATAEISERVREIMMEKGRLNRRLVKAFPKLEAKEPAPRRKAKKSPAKDHSAQKAK